MTYKKLIALALTAVVTTSLAIWLSTNKQTRAADPTKTRYLIGNIEPSLIDAIEIGTADDKVKIERMGKTFVVRGKDNYPADVLEINDLITKCTDITITESITDDPANHKALGVVDENASSQVKFLKSDGTVLAGVIIGSSKETGNGTYIRQTGKDQVYVTLENPGIKSGEMDYIDQQLFNAVSKESIDSVTITQADGKYTLKVNDKDKIVPDRNREDGVLKETAVKNVFTALSDLRFDDVIKDDETLKFNKSYVCHMENDIVYNMFLAEKDGKTYMTCNAIYKGQLPKKSREFLTREELQEKEELFLNRDSAVDFSKKHSGWVYEISDTYAKNLTMTLDELFEKAEKDEEPDTEKTAVSADTE